MGQQTFLVTSISDPATAEPGKGAVPLLLEDLHFEGTMLGTGLMWYRIQRRPS